MKPTTEFQKLVNSTVRTSAAAKIDSAAKL